MRDGTARTSPRSSPPILVTDLGDGRAHHPGDDDSPISGELRALCGRTITPAPIIDPIGRTCRDCAAQQEEKDRRAEAERKRARQRRAASASSWWGFRG